MDTYIFWVTDGNFESEIAISAVNRISAEEQFVEMYGDYGLRVLDIEVER